MTPIGLKSLGRCLYIFFLLFPIAQVSIPCSAAEPIAPERNISVVRAEPGTPEWKVLWDQARILARQKRYPEAGEIYARLYQRKPNIEEAAWEYCKILLVLENYDTAEKIIDELLEKNPHRIDYLLAGASIAVHKQNYGKAIHLYGRVLEKDPTGENSETALEGLANSLRDSGQKGLALPLFIQLLQRRPDDRELIHQLARDAHELGRDSLATVFYSQLLADPVIDDTIIFQAAEIFEAVGDRDKSSSLWNRYLEHHPYYLPFHMKLVDYYKEKKNFEAALDHLAFLADNIHDNGILLVQAGNLCLHELNRPDKALQYFERYRNAHPQDSQIVKTIADIQTSLANDFLTIVENDGAWLLWRDLAEVAPNRMAIYLEMADLLEKQKKIPELLEILTIIHQNSADSDKIALRIAGLYYDLQQYNKALVFLDTVREENRTKAFYNLKGKTEIQLGQETDALASFERGLRLDPQDTAMRRLCLELAGRTGMVETLRSLYAEGVDIHGADLPYDLVVTQLEMLSYNFLFDECAKIHRQAEHHFAGNAQILIKLKLRQAKLLRRSGNARGAEQLLRQLLNGERFIDEVLYSLAEDAIVDKNFVAAKVWQQTLQERIAKGKADSVNDARLLFLRIQQLRMEGDYAGAQAAFADHGWDSKKLEEEKSGSLPLTDLAKELCRLDFYSGNYRQALAATGQLLEGVAFEPEILTLRQILDRRLGLSGDDSLITGRLTVDGRPVVSRLIALAGKEVEYKEHEAAEGHLTTVLDIIPKSVVGNMVLARLMVDDGRLDGAMGIYARLAVRFPGEKYFRKKMIEIEVRRGRYAQALLIFNDQAASSGSQPFDMSSSTDETIEEQLTLARLLWGNKQYEKSLKQYKLLLDPTVVELLAEQFRKKQINYLYLTREHTFWSSMMLMLQSEPEIIGELMEPEFLVKNRGNEAGKIVTQYFDKYSWQSLINNEYMAREASYNRNYRYAEQSYKRLLEKEESTEGMLDLATIYSRTGEYRKEAKVYEAIQDRGSTSPDLADSIERTALQLSPQNTIDGSYTEMFGRDNYINMAKTSIGTSFLFTPDLDKDVNIVYTNNGYKAVDGGGKLRSNMLYGGGIYEFTKNYEVRFGGGMEIFDDESGTEFMYDAELNGQLDDYLHGYLRFEKRPVYDTIDAIKTDIAFHMIETGLNFETSIGMAFGGDLGYRSYSDGNSQNRFHGYSSYSIFGESLQFSFRYDYQYIQSDEGNDTETYFIREPLYWSPGFYSEHRFSLNFQHNFLGYESGLKRGISYYAIDGGVGYEDDQTLSYTGKFDIFLEIDPHFLLKGNFTYSTSDVYEEKGVSVSLHYRW